MASRIEVREGTQEGALVATMKGWSYDGTLTLAEGRQFKWRSDDPWQSAWKWLSADEGELMEFTRTHALQRLTRVEAKLALTDAVADFPEAALLATLGWYLMILRAIDPATPTAP